MRYNMNIFKKAFCRVYQFCFHAALPVLPYREPKKLGDVAGVALELKSKGASSVLLVTDKFLYESGSTARLEEALGKSNIKCAVYSETRPNPTVQNCYEAKSLYIKEACTAIIAFGGGSSIDCAKAVGALIAYPKRTLDGIKGNLRVWRKLPTLVAIPTTAGTGSEVTVTAVITDAEKKHKYTMNNFTTIPHYAVLDPEVTFTLPPHLTATTGMDALTHAVESYIGRSTSKETRALALKATKLIFENIETAYADGKNRVARDNMLHAAYMAGICLSKSYVGYIHAVAHSLGGQYNTPHGLANSVLMPIVLRDYGSAVHKKLWRLGIAAGVATKDDSYADGAEKFISAIEEKNEKMGIGKVFPEIKKEDIPTMALHADKEANPLYPVPVLMDAKQLEKYYLAVAE